MKRGFLNKERPERPVVQNAPSSSCQKLEHPLPEREVEFPVGNMTTTLPPHISHQYQEVEIDPDFMDYPDDTCFYTTLPPYDNEFTECIFIGPGPKRIALSTPGFPQPVPKPPKTLHRLGNSYGGIGMFATHDLKMNDLIFAERPLMMIPSTQAIPVHVPAGTPMEQAKKVRDFEHEKILHVAFKRMLPEDQEALLALANSHRTDGKGPILGAIETNGFLTTLGEARYAFVCKVLSRINHSCTPNANINFKIASFSSELRAVRDIKKGEEIFVAYCDLHSPTAKRQERLKSYGFMCTCMSCANPASSDKKRKEIIQSAFQADVYQTGRRDLDHAAVLKKSLEWMAKIEAEGLQILPAYGRHVDTAMRASAALRKVEDFRKYGTMRSAWGEVAHGNPLIQVIPMFR